MEISTCKSCGASISWVTTVGGKKMPVDVGRKTIMVSLPANSADKERPGYTPGIHYWTAFTGHESHFATCPNADQHRKKS